MKPWTAQNRQRGATLVVGLIMLGLITVLVATAFSLSSTNLKSVGNMQFRNEAIAATNRAIEMVIASPFTVAPVAQTISVDINNDDKPDYNVMVAAPVCVRATPANTLTQSSLSLGKAMSQGREWNTTWEIVATVNDVATGASVSIVSGVRIVRSQSEKSIECP